MSTIWLFFAFALGLTSASSQSTTMTTIRGPPQAKQKEMKVIARIGDNVRLVCPITGFPAPMVEWSKNGEAIDYTWERHRTGRKSLKIKTANEDDTGVFNCKGINGFGSEEVRIELIVVDPRKLPKSMTDAESIEVAPPVMTYETRASPLFHSNLVGDTFKVSCEALGSPQPEIFWFKDGQHIDEAVHFQRGKSTVEFSVMGTADAGVYTCRARNLIGEVTQNYTLEVRQPIGTTHAIVTEAGPADATVLAGDEATLQCRVKSIAPPHIKWLKRLDGQEISLENTLRVGHERYLILESNQDVSTGSDEYLNKLVINKATAADSGMYICFVTNSGFGALTYKSMHLTVVEKPGKIPVPIIPSNGDSSGQEEPLPILILVICLALSVLLLLFILVACVLKKKRKNSDESAPSSPEAQRPFMVGDPQHHLLVQQHQQLGSQKPLPPTPFMHNQWTTKIYPKMSSNQAMVIGTTDSGYADHDLSKDFDSVGNQYEVPYAYLLPQKSNSTTDSVGSGTAGNPRQFLMSSECLSSSSPNSYFDAKMSKSSQSVPITGFSSDHPNYSMKHHRHLQYHSDYESQ